ncbi:MAG: dTDP-4-amino-4,6-dideoxygalactose transaminase [Saprospiraceae bacterium]|nr:dTDP-4-amino-4,6-dideoxygalactose transaminase [Saprospiraceae bacterium]
MEAIPFHKYYTSGEEIRCVEAVIGSQKIAQHPLHAQCHELISKICGHGHVQLTSSCTHALEAAMMTLGLTPNDEVVIPSFAYMSIANAVLRTGAKIVFADVDAKSMNLSLSSLQNAVSSSTKAVIFMHYGGLSYDIQPVLDFCENNDIILIEDAAHCIGATFNGRHLGTFGDFGTLSFHHTKNIHCSEGGALIVRNADHYKNILQIVEKGTNRQAFLRGEIDRYDWVTVGSSFTMNNLSSAFLFGQLADLEKITTKRKEIWKEYYDQLKDLEQIDLPLKSSINEGNGHIFFLKTRTFDEREELITYQMKHGISAYFHYPALHASEAGKKYASPRVSCKNALEESQKLLRLPIYPKLRKDQVNYICDRIHQFYATR